MIETLYRVKMQPDLVYGQRIFSGDFAGAEKFYKEKMDARQKPSFMLPRDLESRNGRGMTYVDGITVSFVYHDPLPKPDE